MINPTRHFASWLIATALTCLAPSGAMAHDILLLPESGEQELSVTVKYGHPGEYTLPDREKLFALDLYAANAPVVSLLDALKPRGPDTLVLKIEQEQLQGSAGAIIGARFDNGYYAEIDKDHYYNTSKRELPKAIKSGHFLKFAKSLIRSTKGNAGKQINYGLVLGYRLELIPQADPFALKPGDTLPVQVLFDGKPVGAGVAVDVISGEFTMTKGMELPSYKTNEQGVAQVKLERAGIQSLGADRTVSPSADPQLADEENYASSLSFFLSAQ